MSFPDAALSLTDAASRGDLIAAWDSAVRLLPWLSDLRNQIDARSFHTLLWTGAINNRWFDIAELLAAAVAARADAPISIRRIHAQMLVERGYTE